MDLEELKQTDLWNLYEKGRNYCRLINLYTDTDKHIEFYNGDQWKGLKVKGIEPVQLNFIKPIVKYKVGTINSNQWAVNYSSDNFENKEFRQLASKVCELLNKRASKVWDRDGLDLKIRKVTKDSAINDEGIIYVTYDVDKQNPVNEIINKNDIQYGNENDSDIQRQPYIILKQRRPVIEVQEMARKEGVSEDKLDFIIGDNDTFEEAGESAKQEKDDHCTLITKLYKENGTVHFAKATRWVEIKEDTDSGLTLYPIAHMVWEEKEGSARGEGEVRHLIPNQIEVNKTLMRRLITVKQTAYPQKVVNIDKIQNPSAINEVGGILKTKGGMSVEDVGKIFSVVPPSQMSADVEKVQNELISLSRELAGAGDIAVGDVDPEKASGKAILAVQQASQQPLIEQLSGLKDLIEQMARIWLDMWTVYSEEGITLEEEVQDQNGQEYTVPFKVDQVTLEELQASCRVDITPKGAFDRFAQEQSLENLLNNGYFSVQRLGELKVYAKVLDDDSTMPKQKIEEAIRIMEEEQQRIALIEQQAQLMQERANQFLMGDPDAQSEQLLEAEMQMEREGMQDEREAIPEEREEVGEEVEEEAEVIEEE